MTSDGALQTNPKESTAEPARGDWATATWLAGQSMAVNAVPAVAAPMGPVVAMVPSASVKDGVVPLMAKGAHRNCTSSMYVACLPTKPTITWLAGQVTVCAVAGVGRIPRSGSK